MNQSRLLDDYIYVVDTIKATHPMGITGLPKNVYEFVDRSVNDILDENTLIIHLCRLTAMLLDGHTNIEIEYTQHDKCVNLPCIWLDDGLFVTKDYSGMLKGDKIISIGSLAIDEVLKLLCSFIPHENEYLVKMRATTYPFINYHIFSEFILRYFNVINTGIVKVTATRNSEVLTFDLPLVNYNSFLDFRSNEKFIDYRIDTGVAILKIDECKYNDEYIIKIKEFFKLVKDENIQAIILDLRENMGGSSSVATEFLKHIDIHSYFFYGVQVRNPNDSQMIEVHSEKHGVINSIDTSAGLFMGKIMCLVSNKTFSSARIFATILKDNNIATIVGEPTGGKPCSFGNPLRFETPNFKIKFRVSSRSFKRPALDCQNDIALYPDISIYPKIENIIQGQDIVLSRAIKMCLDP